MAVKQVSHELRFAAEGGGAHDGLLAAKDPLVSVVALDAHAGFVARLETRLVQRCQRSGPLRVVRETFTRYAAGVSPRKIAFDLNSTRAPSPSHAAARGARVR